MWPRPVLRALGAIGARRVLSIVAGISSDRLEAALPAGSVVVRAMPNTPSLVGAGVAGLSGGMAATSADLDWAEGILSAVGTVVRLPERQLDAVTGISGSGPAYVFLVAEAMIEAGVTAGLHPGRQQAAGRGHPPRLASDAGRDGSGAGRAPGGRDLARWHHGRRRPHTRIQGRAIGIHRGGGRRHRAIAATRPLTGRAVADTWWPGTTAAAMPLARVRTPSPASIGRSGSLRPTILAVRTDILLR